MLERAKHFSIKQLATQAGVSKATVDRVLHQRGSVHYQTHRRIEQALNELEAQEKNGLAAGRTFHVDVIMHTPQRFSAAVQAAMTAQLSSLAPFRIAPRFHLFEEIEPQAMRDQLLRCASTGSQGVVLKAADEPAVNLAVKQLAAVGIPSFASARNERTAWAAADRIRADLEWARETAITTRLDVLTQSPRPRRISRIAIAAKTNAPSK